MGKWAGCRFITVSPLFIFYVDEKTKQMMQIQKEDYKEHLSPQPSSQPKVDDDDGDDDDDDDDEYSDSDYDYDDDYDYEDKDDEEDDNKAYVEKDEDDGDDYDDEVDEWLKSNTKKLNLDSEKIYDYSKDLKKGESF